MAFSALLITSHPGAHGNLRIISPGLQFLLHQVAGLEAALSYMRGRNVPVVICERDLPDGTWIDLIGANRALPRPARVIVCTRLADEALWLEVLNEGGFDVVVSPFDPREISRVAFAAYDSWRHQWREFRSRPERSPSLRQTTLLPRMSASRIAGRSA